MKLKRLSILCSSFVLSVASLLTIAFPGIAHALTTDTWTGGGDGYTFNDASNWSGGVPVAGDVLQFGTFTGTPNCPDPNGDGGFISNEVCLTNNIPGNPAFGGIVATGGTAFDIYSINTVQLSDGSTFQQGSPTSQTTVDVTSLSSPGSITLDGGVALTVTATNVTALDGAAIVNAYIVDNLTITSGTLQSVAPAVGQPFPVQATSITVDNGATYQICSQASTEADIAAALTLGGGSGADPVIELEPCQGGGSGPVANSGVIKLEGNTTLLSNATISVNNSEVYFDGSITTNGHTLTTTGTTGSTVKGDGSAGAVGLDGTSILAPGHSPGCLNVSSLTLSGTYTADIGGTTACTGYDQVVDSGSVNITGATLAVSLVNGFTPTAGQSFEIVDNTGGSPVTGTFASLPEGSTVTVGGVVFKISYVGDGGNSIVLTVQSTPKTPDTGFGLTSAHIGLPLAGSLMMAGGIYFISRKVKHPVATKRR